VNKRVESATWIWIAVSLAAILTTGLGAGWLLQRYDQQRGFDQEAGQIASVMELKPGSMAADVIAGSGKWSVDMSRRVGPTGRIYATEADPEQFTALKREMQVYPNISVLYSTDEKSGLDAGCCDAILIRAAYHHIRNHREFNATLWAALRPDGRLAIIDFDQGTQEYQGGHGIARTRLVEIMTASGFEVAQTVEDWSGHAYCVIFRRARAPVS
jgi:predicted methyltransferase